MRYDDDIFPKVDVSLLKWMGLFLMVRQGCVYSLTRNIKKKAIGNRYANNKWWQ